MVFWGSQDAGSVLLLSGVEKKDWNCFTDNAFFWYGSIIPGIKTVFHTFYCYDKSVVDYSAILVWSEFPAFSVLVRYGSVIYPVYKKCIVQGAEMITRHSCYMLDKISIRTEVFSLLDKFFCLI